MGNQDVAGPSQQRPPPGPVAGPSQQRTQVQRPPQGATGGAVPRTLPNVQNPVNAMPGTSNNQNPRKRKNPSLDAALDGASYEDHPLPSITKEYSSKFLQFPI